MRSRLHPAQAPNTGRAPPACLVRDRASETGHYFLGLWRIRANSARMLRFVSLRYTKLPTACSRKAPACGSSHPPISFPRPVVVFISICSGKKHPLSSLSVFRPSLRGPSWYVVMPSTWRALFHQMEPHCDTAAPTPTNQVAPANLTVSLTSLPVH